MTFPGGAEWQKVEHHLMPDQAIRSVAGWYEDIPQWYVLRKYLEVGRPESTSVWGGASLKREKMSTIHLQGEPGYCQGIWGFVENPRGKNYLRRHSFPEHSTWGKLLNTDQLEELIVAKPSLIGMAPLESVIEKFGVSQAFVEIFNARFGLEVTLSDNRLFLSNYPSILDFAGATCIGSMRRKVIHFADCLGPGDRIDLLECLGCTFKSPTTPKRNFSGFGKDATKNFIQTMNLGQGNDLVPLLNEIIYRYGPPDPRLLVCEQAA